MVKSSCQTIIVKLMYKLFIHVALNQGLTNITVVVNIFSFLVHSRLLKVKQSDIRQSQIYYISLQGFKG